MFTEYNLHRVLASALEQRGFATPTPVQQETLPLSLAGRDLLVSSETGSGKTLAYLIPLLQSLLTTKAAPSSGSRSLILVPTRELADQVFKQCQKLLAATRVSSVLVTGGQESDFQSAKLLKDPDVIVATPGRLIQMIQTGAAKLDDVQFLVLDEADRMLDMGFSEDVLAIIEQTPPSRQTLLLSATLKHRGVGTIADLILRDPEHISLATAQDKHANIRHQLILADDFEHKLSLTKTLIAQGSYKQVLVFANKRTTVDDLANLLKPCGYTNKLHGEMRQDARKKVIASYRQGQFPILVATDVAARGLDINGIELVINFDMPHSGDEYVHRVGRTGRQAELGLAISLVEPKDWNLSESIQRYLKQEFEPTVVKDLQARFKGPNKLAAKKRKKADKQKTKSSDKPKQRQRDKKNVGKRRQPDTPAAANSGGFTPPKRPLKQNRNDTSLDD